MKFIAAFLRLACYRFDSCGKKATVAWSDQTGRSQFGRRGHFV